MKMQKILAGFGVLSIITVVVLTISSFTTTHDVEKKTGAIKSVEGKVIANITTTEKVKNTHFITTFNCTCNNCRKRACFVAVSADSYKNQLNLHNCNICVCVRTAVCLCIIIAHLRLQEKPQRFAYPQSTANCG